MKNIKKTITQCLIATILLGQATTADTLIRAEDTEGKYIKAVELENKRYQFFECIESTNGQLECSPFFNENKSFSKQDIYDLSRQNRRNAMIAGAADVGIIALSLYLGMIGASYATASYYTAAGASLDGGVAAVGGFFFGVPTGAATASSVTIAASDLDPFMHRDISLAMKEVIGIADKGDLDDIEAEMNDYGTVVEIEDIDYDRLAHKLRAQLMDL